MLQLSWTVEGEKQLSRVLRNIGDEATNWEPAFAETAKALKEVFSKDVFETQGREIQEKWPPLSGRYLRQKVKQGYPATPLIKTGHMRASFVAEAKADYAKVWNSAEYFKYHQSKAPRTMLPRRVMMKLAENQKQLVVKIFHTYWVKKLKRSTV